MQAVRRKVSPPSSPLRTKLLNSTSEYEMLDAEHHEPISTELQSRISVRVRDVTKRTQAVTV